MHLQRKARVQGVMVRHRTGIDGRCFLQGKVAVKDEIERVLPVRFDKVRVDHNRLA